MAENVVLQLILDGISTLETKADLDVVKDAVKKRRTEIQILDEEKLALAKGNTDEMIRVNNEKYDYSKVKKNERDMAVRWYMAPKPYSSTRSAYDQWRVWNVPTVGRGENKKLNENYKGYLIIEKASGKSVSPTECESEDEDGEEEVTEAMAAVRVE